MLRQKIERFALQHVLSRLPEAVLVRLGGGKPVTHAGRTLHPLFQAMMFANRNRPGLEVLPPPRARQAYTQVIALAEPDELPMAGVRDEAVDVDGGSIRVRCYAPPGLPARRHVGIYAYRVAFLHRFVGWPTGTLEAFESLEQLRALEHGEAIHVEEAGAAVPGGVDTPADLERVARLLGGRA